MRSVDIIEKKRDGEELSTREIEFLITGYVQGDIPDYQISAWLMAIYLNGMTPRETADLTMAMVRSGDVIDLSAIHGTKVDKHSTGGVGDKTSLILAPLVASVGVPVAKMSGRGLGHTGGTVDKLESISGFKIELKNEQFIHNVNDIKLALVGQSGNLVPADKMLYALRDVTGTVSSIPLIASSIMSKKIASGANAIVLDVKFGSGAFMKTLEDAKKLATAMVDIGNSLNRRTIAVLSNMDEPLGHEVGNANEIKEVVDVLNGDGEKRLTELCLTLASYMCVAAGKHSNYEEAYNELTGALRSKAALEKFQEFIEAQGGNAGFIQDVGHLPQATYHLEIRATQSGYVHSLDAEKIGVSAMLLGAGRQTKEDAIDYAAGITLKKKIGDQVNTGDVIAILHSNKEDMTESKRLAMEAFIFSSTIPEQGDMVSEVIM